MPLRLAVSSYLSRLRLNVVVLPWLTLIYLGRLIFWLCYLLIEVRVKGLIASDLLRLLMRMRLLNRKMWRVVRGLEVLRLRKLNDPRVFLNIRRCRSGEYNFWSMRPPDHILLIPLRNMIVLWDNCRDGLRLAVNHSFWLPLREGILWSGSSEIFVRVMLDGTVLSPWSRPYAYGWLLRDRLSFVMPWLAKHDAWLLWSWFFHGSLRKAFYSIDLAFTEIFVSISGNLLWPSFLQNAISLAVILEGWKVGCFNLGKSSIERHFFAGRVASSTPPVCVYWPSSVSSWKLRKSVFFLSACKRQVNSGSASWRCSWIVHAVSSFWWEYTERFFYGCWGSLVVGRAGADGSIKAFVAVLIGIKGQPSVVGCCHLFTFLRNVDVEQGLYLSCILKRLKVLWNNKPPLSANIFECNDGVGKSESILTHKCPLDVEVLCRLVCVAIDYVDDFHDHVLLSSLSKHILFWNIFVYVLIAPYFQLPLLTNVKHAFEYLKVSIALVQQLKALECHQVTV